MTDRLALIKARHAEAGGGDGDKCWLIAEVERLRAALTKILGWREYHDHLPERTAGAVVEFVEQTASEALRAKEE